MVGIVFAFDTCVRDSRSYLALEEWGMRVMYYPYAFCRPVKLYAGKDCGVLGRNVGFDGG
jgi:hypothetical protein